MKSKIYIFLLVLLAFLTHIYWFIPNSILTYGDWLYLPHQALIEQFSSWGTWLTYVNLGYGNIQIPFLLFTSVWSLIGNLGFSYDIATKITFFIPIAILSFISPFVLSKKITGDNLVSFLVAMFYATTTYVITTQVPIQFIYALSPLLILFFMSSLEKNTFKNWLIFVIIFSISVCYEIRMTYLMSFILLIYFIYFYSNYFKKYIFRILFSGVILVLTNSFWILPTVFGGLTSDIAQITNRSLFGENLLDLTHSLTLSNWLWTGGKPDATFTQQPIFWYFWLVPFLGFLSFAFFKKFSFLQKKTLIFFSIVTLLGIFLTKQSDFPFPGAYKFLYNYFPGFNLFRESSKFFLISSIGYLGLISFTLLGVKKSFNNKVIRILVPLLVVMIFIMNISPLLNGSIGELFVPRVMPNEYVVLENFINKQNSFFRSLWVPSSSRWGLLDNEHPRADLITLFNTTWKDFNNPSTDKEPEAVTVMNFLKNSKGESLINMISAKYIITPIDEPKNDDIYFSTFGKPKDYYLKELNSIKYLHKIDIGTKQINIYENKNYKPHIYLTIEKESIEKKIEYKNVNYYFNNPSQYSINLSNVKDSFYLNFAENFHKNWKLRIGNFNWFEPLIMNRYFMDDKFHYKNDAGLNSYFIDVKSLCEKFSCIKNENGSYNLKVTLYFLPQSYFYLGFLISVLTSAVIIAFLIYQLTRNIYD